MAKKSVIDYLVAYRVLHSLEFCALALGNVYGPRHTGTEAGVVSIFAERILRGQSVTIFGNGEQTRDFVFVDDVVDAFVLAAANRGGGLVCNVATGQETSVNHLLDTMADVVGVDVTAMMAPPRPAELMRSSLDIERAAIQLGWRPWTDLADGTRAVFEHIRAHLD